MLCTFGLFVALPSPFCGHWTWLVLVIVCTLLCTSWLPSSIAFWSELRIIILLPRKNIQQQAKNEPARPRQTTKLRGYNNIPLFALQTGVVSPCFIILHSQFSQVSMRSYCGNLFNLKKKLSYPPLAFQNVQDPFFLYYLDEPMCSYNCAFVTLGIHIPNESRILVYNWRWIFVMILLAIPKWWGHSK